MKVTENSTYRLMQTNLNRITSTLQELQYQGATGLKLNKASDDPGSIRPVLTTRTQLNRTDRYLETMGVGLDKMQSIDSHLGNIENILQRAKELAHSSVNGAMSDSDLATIGDEIAELKKQLLDTANATIDGKYIFAGFEENTIPFAVNDNYDPALYDETTPSTWPYYYYGDTNPTELEVSPGEYQQITLTGNELFFGVSNDNWTGTGAGAAAAGAPEPGQVDIFSVLTRLEEAVRAGNVDDPAGDGGSIQAQIDNLEVAADQNRRLRSQQGTKANRVEAAIQMQEMAKIDLEQILSRYQDADAIETFNDIMQQETAYQAALNVTARVSEISILDYF